MIIFLNRRLIISLLVYCLTAMLITTANTMNNDRRLPIAEKVLRELRQRILSGFYPPDTYLPAERAIAREYGTSRTTVAAAFTALADQGFVEQSRGRGTRILPPSRRLASRPLAVIHYSGPRTDIWPESMRILRGAQEVFARLDYPYQPFLSAGADPHNTAQTLAEKYSGVLMIETFEQQLALALEARRVPLVVANLEVELNVSATCVDHAAVTRRAVQTLVHLGHRRIAFLSRPPTRSFHGQARAGYLAGLADAGLEPEDTLIAVCDGPSALTAYFAAAKLLQLPQPPTAFVAARDVFAEGICRAVEEAGMIVGRDISVIGFDDLSWPTDNPLLTTFREPCSEMGAAAAEMLIKRVADGWRPPEKRVLAAEFILRRSAGPYHPAAAVSQDRAESAAP